MGLLDTVTSMLSGKDIDIAKQLQELLPENMAGILKNPQVANILNNIDQQKITELISHIQSNGVPKDVAGFTALLNKFQK